MNKKSHHKYLTHNIAKTYKKVNRSKVNRIDFKRKRFSKNQQQMTDTAQKIKFYIMDFFSKCDQIRSFLRI